MRLIVCLMAAGLCLAAEAQAPTLSSANPYYSVSGADLLRSDDEAVLLARMNAAAMAAEDASNPRIAADLLAYEDLYRRYTRSRLVQIATASGQLDIDPGLCAATPATISLRVPNVPAINAPGLPQAKARFEALTVAWGPAAAAVLDAAAARHREAFLAEARKRGVGGPDVKGMETPAVASLEKDYACILSEGLKADLRHLIRLANEPAYAKAQAEQQAARERQIAEGRLPLEMATGPLFRDRAKEDLASSPRERQLGGIAPAWPYAEPTDTEIGLAVMRELQQFGCRLEEGLRCAVAGGAVVLVPHVATAAPCLTGRNGWSCRVLIHSEIVLPGDAYADAVAKQNAASPSLSEELFVLTSRGWRSPTLNARIAAADQRAKAAANRGFSKPENGVLCRAAVLTPGADALQKSACS